MPVAPRDLTAQRRGDRVDLRFVVPAENTDGSRPANIARVDIYALTGPTNVPDEVLLKRGTRVASVQVRRRAIQTRPSRPAIPSATSSPRKAAGLDQGAVATAHEDLGPDALQPIDVTVAGDSTATLTHPAPLVGPVGAPSRTFVGVGISTRRAPRGFYLQRVVVPWPCAPCAVAAERDVRARPA